MKKDSRLVLVKDKEKFLYIANRKLARDELNQWAVNNVLNEVEEFAVKLI